MARLFLLPRRLLRGKELRSRRYFNVLLSVAVGVLGSAIVYSLAKGKTPTVVSPSLHSALEAIGAFSALVTSLLLFLQLSAQERGSHYKWLGYGLMLMGIFGLAHGSLPAGDPAELFDIFGLLVGGFFSSMLWLPDRFVKKKVNATIPLCVGSVAALFSLAILFIANFPEGLLWEGWVTDKAQSLNAAGSLLFVLGSVNLFFRYYKNRWTEDLLFAGLCLLSGLSALLLPWFTFWTVGFWIWHVMQLLGYVSALAYIFLVHRRNHEETLRYAERIRAINETLEEKVASRSRALAERAELLAKSEAQLQEQSNLLQLVLNNMTDGVMMADEKGTLLLTNPAVRRILNLSENCSETPWLAYPKSPLRPLLDAAVKGNPVDEEQVTLELAPSGMGVFLSASSRPVFDAAGKKVGGVMVLRDVTQTRAAERAAKAGNERFETLARVTRDMVWDWDLLSGAVWTSEEWYRWIGHRPDIANSRDTWRMIIHPDDRERVMASLQRTLASEDSLWSEEFRFVRSDGTYAYMLDRGCVLRREDKRPLRMIGLMTDISKTKEAENRLRQQTEALARSNKDLEQFAYVASHDLKEPLRMVTSYVQLLQRRYEGKLDPDALEFIRYAANGASRMHSLIDDLLAYSQLERKGVAFSRTDCNEVIQSVLADLKPAIQEAEAEVKVGTLPSIFADKTQVGQLFQNLISNALKYRRQPRPSIELQCDLVDSNWIFCVSDNGIGIPRELTDRIFNLFQRLHTKEEYPGTGIGLAICKRILERHGGKIWVESLPGVGSSFYFAIPDRPLFLAPELFSSSLEPELPANDKNIA